MRTNFDCEQLHVTFSDWLFQPKALASPTEPASITTSVYHLGKAKEIEAWKRCRIGNPQA
jgi:hypothetical protein